MRKLHLRVLGVGRAIWQPIALRCTWHASTPAQLQLSPRAPRTVCPPRAQGASPVVASSEHCMVAGSSSRTAARAVLSLTWGARGAAPSRGPKRRVTHSNCGHARGPWQQLSTRPCPAARPALQLHACRHAPVAPHLGVAADNQQALAPRRHRVPRARREAAAILRARSRRRLLLLLLLPGCHLRLRPLQRREIKHPPVRQVAAGCSSRQGAGRVVVGGGGASDQVQWRARAAHCSSAPMLALLHARSAGPAPAGGRPRAAPCCCGSGAP